MSDPFASKSKPKVLNTDRVFNNVEQFILTENMDEINDFYTSQAKPTAQGGQNDFKYYHYRQINGPGAQLVNRLRGIDDLSVFYKIRTSTLSLLQPKFRLYKVTYSDYELNADGTVNQASVKPLPNPCYREIKFSDNFGEETARSVQDYLSYESTKPSFRNVGLKSFLISQNGETHGAVENNIECKMSLTFKSLKDIMASPPGDSSVRYVDLILWPPSRISKDTQTADPQHYEIKVLMGYTAPSEEQLIGLSVPADEIKAIRNIEKLNQVVSLGMYDYNIDIKEDGSVDVTVTYRGRLETIMGTNQVNVFQNTIRIGTNGRVDTLDNTDAKLNTAHFYKLANAIKTINADLNKDECVRDCKSKQTLRDLCTGDSVFVDIIKKAVDNSSLKTTKDDFGLIGAGKVFKIHNEDTLFAGFKTSFKSNIVLNELKREVGFAKKQIIQSFMESLINGSKKEGGLTRFFTAEVGSGKIQEAVGLIDSERTTTLTGPEDSSSGLVTVSQSLLNEKVSAMTSAISTGQLTYKFGRGNVNKEKTAQEISDEASRITSASDGADEEASSKDEDDGAKKKKKKVEPVGSVPTYLLDGNHKFYFLFLGDIIELACRNAGLPSLLFDQGDGGNIKTDSIFATYNPTADQINKTSFPLKNAGIILGPLEYINKDGIPKTINLARMPISFKFFKSWFIEKIVKMNRFQMPLGSFLAALINDLVVPALGLGMPGSKKSPGSKTNIVSITLPGKILSERKIGTACGNQTIPALEEYLPMSRVLNTESADFKTNYFNKIAKPRSSESLVKTSFDYILIFMSSYRDIIQRRGDPATDVAEGIYHFNIGSDRGLLKSMKFSKVNLPFLAELRSEQAEEQGVDQLSQLAFPFNTDVDLVGTSLFVPGMHFYVNPSLVGLGRPEEASSIAGQLGLGGYHLVQKVSTNIMPGKFVTSVEGTQTAQGRK